MHPSGAMFWEEKQMLLVSDVHLGKISHFRKYGSAVPHNAIAQNFERLTEVVEHFQPARICFLGDLFHSSLNLEWDLFENWMQDISAQVMLVIGNHDIISELKYEALSINIFSELVLGKFLLTHHPEGRDEFYNICGHLHPGYNADTTVCFDHYRLSARRCSTKASTAQIITAIVSNSGLSIVSDFYCVSGIGVVTDPVASADPVFPGSATDDQ